MKCYQGEVAAPRCIVTGSPIARAEASDGAGAS